ncbi:MAG: sulfurtransferase [Cohaesibacteraceae bacterium]
MQSDLTRRRFVGSAFTAVAALSVGAVTLQGKVNLAQAVTNEYANPDLLMWVEELLPITQPDVDASRTIYDTLGIAVVDVRPAEAFYNGHIPGARHLDPNAVVASEAPVTGALKPETELAAMIGELGIDAGTRVVLYDDRGGFHAARMFWLMEYLGHQNVSLLNGGLTAWSAAGGDLTTEATGYAPRHFVPSAMPRRQATADYLLRHQDDAETVVVDVRPVAMYEDGHIPWAVNVPWALNLDENKLYWDAATLEAHFAAHGVTPDRNVVIHCQVGLASSHSYVALRLLGYPRVRVYHRSWAEWSAGGDLPVGYGS